MGRIHDLAFSVVEDGVTVATVKPIHLKGGPQSKLRSDFLEADYLSHEECPTIDAHGQTLIVSPAKPGLTYYLVNGKSLSERAKAAMKKDLSKAKNEFSVCY